MNTIKFITPEGKLRRVKIGQRYGCSMTARRAYNIAKKRGYTHKRLKTVA
jgi:hypothetical protein